MRKVELGDFYPATTILYAAMAAAQALNKEEGDGKQRWRAEPIAQRLVETYIVEGNTVSLVRQAEDTLGVEIFREEKQQVSGSFLRPGREDWVKCHDLACVLTLPTNEPGASHRSVDISMSYSGVENPTLLARMDRKYSQLASLLAQNLSNGGGNGKQSVH